MPTTCRCLIVIPARVQAHTGASNRAIVTAALLTLDPATIGMLAAANMLTPDGRCKTLDAAADGCDPAGLCRRLPGMASCAKPY